MAAATEFGVSQFLQGTSRQTLFLKKKPQRQRRSMFWGALWNRNWALGSTHRALPLRCQAQENPRAVVSGGVSSSVEEQPALVEKPASEVVHLYRVPFMQASAAAELLKEAQVKISGQIVEIQTEQCYNVGLSSQLSGGKFSVLRWLLQETFEPENLGTESFLEKKKKEGLSPVIVEVGPRLSFTTAWSTNAVAICQACGLTEVNRLERSRRYLLFTTTELQDYQINDFTSMVHDRMTECVYLSLSLSFPLLSSSPSSHNPQKPSWNDPIFTSSGEAGSFLRGIDVNRLPSVVDCEEEAGVSSPNSTVSSVSGKRSERETNGEENDTDRACSRGIISDEEDAETSRKKLRLSKDQSIVLEESFKEHNTLNPKQKLALAKQLGLRARQVEVWFQNRRARTKLKQTEVDCEFLKRCCENLTEENRRLQKEVQELRALKLSPQFYMHMTPPTTLTMCPSCERVAVPPSSAVDPATRHHHVPPSHPRAFPIGPWARPFDALRPRS